MKTLALGVLALNLLIAVSMPVYAEVIIVCDMNGNCQPIIII